MLTVDMETKSWSNLLKTGASSYSQHPTTDIIVLSWGRDGVVLGTWWPGIEDAPYEMIQCSGGGMMPKEIYMAIMKGEQIEAHNVSFEYSLWHNVLVKKYGWVAPYDHLWHDTMAVACYYSLPAKLDRLLKVLKMKGKNPEGGRLISKYSCLYNKNAKEVIPDEDFQKWVQYCEEDVLCEMEVSKFLGMLPPEEHKVFLLDLQINSRGLLLDLPGIEAAGAVVDQRAAELTQKFRDIVGKNPTQGEEIKRWFAGHGLPLENLQKDYLKEVMEDQPQGELRTALDLRLRVNKASTKKLDAMLRQRGNDGRARFQSRYHGAGTGRWTGQGFQPLNLTRGFEKMPPDELVRAIMMGNAKYLDMLFGDAMDAVSKASRHWIQAAPGHRIMAGDFVSVEAVNLACLAGEQWKIDAFTRGDKIYELMGDKIYGLDAGTVTKETHPQERFDGKTGELAFGYQGALNAWLNFDSSGRHTDERIIEICKAWRASHPATTDLWAGLERAAVKAMKNPDDGPVFYREIGFEMVEYWLSMILPDGKRLWYWEPEINMARPQWHQPHKKDECRTGDCTCGWREQISYMAMKEGQWKRVTTYGGKLSENATQATSRQALVPAMHALEAAGYPIVLSVYDEIVCEVPNDHGSLEEFTEIMSANPGPWAEGWPIAVDAWEGTRYKK